MLLAHRAGHHACVQLLRDAGWGKKEVSTRDCCGSMCLEGSSNRCTMGVSAGDSGCDESVRLDGVGGESGAEEGLPVSVDEVK